MSLRIGYFRILLFLAVNLGLYIRSPKQKNTFRLTEHDVKIVGEVIWSKDIVIHQRAGKPLQMKFFQVIVANVTDGLGIVILFCVEIDPYKFRFSNK